LSKAKTGALILLKTQQSVVCEFHIPTVWSTVESVTALTINPFHAVNKTFHSVTKNWHRKS